MEKEKKTIGLSIAIILIIISFFCGGVISFIFFGNKVNKENDKEIDDIYVDDGVPIHQMEDGPINLKKEELAKYINMYRLINDGDEEFTYMLSGRSGSTLDYREKFKLMYVSRLIKDSDWEEIECNKFNSDLVEEENSSCGVVSNKSEWKNSNNRTRAIKKEKLNNYYKYFFGRNENLVSDSFFLSKCDNRTFFYDSQIGYYVEIGVNQIGSCDSSLKETILSANKRGEYLDITFKYDNKYDILEYTFILKWEASSEHYIFDSIKYKTI